MLAAWLAICTVQLPSPPSPDTVVARVDGVAISAAEVSAMLWDSVAQQVTQEIAMNRLVRSEAAAKNVVVAPAEVDRANDEQLARFKAGLPDGMDMDAALRERGLSRARIRLAVETDIYGSRLCAVQMKLTDFAKLSTIGVKADPNSPTEQEAARVKLQSALDRLKKGDKWDVVLKATTEDAAFTQNMGDLGWRGYDNFPEAVRPLIRALKPGEYTQPIATPYGMQIFRVDQLGTSATRDEAETLRARYVQTNKAAYLEALRKSDRIKFGS